MQKDEAEIKKASALMTITVFAAFLVFFAVGYITMPYQGVNVTEQRQYARVPKFTAKAFMDGSYAEELETYLSDHLAMRPQLVTLRHDISRLLGRTIPSIVYPGYNGQYYLRFIYDPAASDKTAEAFNAYAQDKNVPIDFLLVPDATLIIPEDLPRCAVIEDEDAIVERFVRGLSDKFNVYYAKDELMHLKEQGGQVFYRTDQHWTTDAAKAVLEWYMHKSGQTVRAVDYRENTVGNFYGNLYSGAPSFFSKPDTVKYYTAPDGEYMLRWLGEDRESDSPIDSSWTMYLNKYNVFLGGTFADLRISSNAPEGRLLILGDSYALPIIVMMADQYSEIAAVDIRQFENRGTTVDELTADFDPDRILIVDTVFQVGCGAVSGVR